MDFSWFLICIGVVFSPLLSCVNSPPLYPENPCPYSGTPSECIKTKLCNSTFKQSFCYTTSPTKTFRKGEHATAKITFQLPDEMIQQINFGNIAGWNGNQLIFMGKIVTRDQDRFHVKYEQEGGNLIVYISSKPVELVDEFESQVTITINDTLILYTPGIYWFHVNVDSSLVTPDSTYDLFTGRTTSTIIPKTTRQRSGSELFPGGNKFKDIYFYSSPLITAMISFALFLGWKYWGKIRAYRRTKKSDSQQTPREFRKTDVADELEMDPLNISSLSSSLHPLPSISMPTSPLTMEVENDAADFRTDGNNFNPTIQPFIEHPRSSEA